MVKRDSDRDQPDGDGPSSSDAENSGEYEVGFARPPKQHQFQKGQSGNPKGRLKGSKNFVTDLREELVERIMVRDGGKARKISKQRAALKTFVAKALSGNINALKALIELMGRHSPADPENEPLTKDDLDIIEAFLNSRRKPKSSSGEET